jgi:diadenosine tetraphosphate (Ap4A) HIT family hydrolase
MTIVSAGDTAIHRMVERCRAGAYPATVARLRSGWLVMGERQPFEGYCVLLPDPVVAHLNVLEHAERAQFLADMALAGDAVLACTGALRINYALFGNAEPALHAHVIPRRISEPADIRGTHPWALDWNSTPVYSKEAHGTLRERIADYLQRTAGGITRARRAPRGQPRES